MRTPVRALAFAAALALVLVACDRAAGRQAAPTATATPPVAATTPTPARTPPPTPTAPPTPVPDPPSEEDLALEPVFDGRRFSRPTEIGIYPSDEGPAFFVAEQDGVIYLLREEADATVLLDLRERVSRQGNEEGLLSVAVDPAFEENGHIWAYYSVTGPRRTRLARFIADVGGDRFDVDPRTELVVLEVEQPFPNHNGGAVRFGPDGMLYLGLGDGGSSGDPQGHGQDTTTLLGSLIRIDVRAASAETPYAIPPDNPFASGSEGRAEVWAYGLRNPWRMAFDPETGALWLADVGQNAVEEVNLIERGGNYGWNRLEGFDCYRPRTGCDREGTVDPVAVYTHAANPGSCSVTGGVVYRGSAIPELRGYYIYGDFCSGLVWAVHSEQPGEPAVILRRAGMISSFGVDEEGEVYILSFGRPVQKLVPR